MSNEDIRYPYADWTWEDLAYKIDSEGFDYFWTDWALEADINDPKLKALVINFKTAQKKLVAYLEERGALL